MITDSYSNVGMLQGTNEFRRQQQEIDRERVLSMFPTDSTSPTVEGSLSTFSCIASDFGCLSEEELRSDSAYIAYYYSNVNLNPRLPLPLQRLQGAGATNAVALGGIGDNRKFNQDDKGADHKSLFSMQLGVDVEDGDIGTEDEKEWGRDGLIGLRGLGLGTQQKIVDEMIQGGMSHTTSTSSHSSHPASRAFGDVVDPSESQFAHLHHELTSLDAVHSHAKIQGTSALQKVNTSGSQSSASALGASLSQSTNLDPQLVARVPSLRFPSTGGGRISSLDKRNLDVPNTSENILSNIGEYTDLVTAFSGMGLSVNATGDEWKHQNTQIHNEIDYHRNLFHLQKDQNPMKQHSYLNKSESVQFHKSACSSAASYLIGPSTPTLSSGGSSPSHYPTVDSPNKMLSPYVLGGYVMNPSSLSMSENQLGGGNFPSLFENIAAGAAMGACRIDPRAIGGGLNLGPNLLAVAAELQNINRLGNQTLGGSVQLCQMDPMHLQYLRSAEYLASQLSAVNDPTVNRESLGNSYMDLLEIQKAYIEALLASQKSQYDFSRIGKSCGFNNGYYGNLGLGVNMSYPGSPLASASLENSPFGPDSYVRYGERYVHFPLGMRNLSGVMGAWDSDPGSNLGECFASSLLDEFKSNKSKCFELSEIEGHVVEFSVDQYGSRFIQQKMETATTEEKNMVFREIMPQALSLMTDVFGNYVIQKLFEHGSASQIRELADQLNGHVLTLSLQMYGCRVVQKAVEVVDLDQQTKMVTELDGHAMRCVRDQNGNHVIQKCIECIPEDAIQFVVSTFYDQVVTLSTHPYGCRVIQRVLEHCHNPETQNIVMKKILQSICMLAQDQYGNYVVQHVLEHGKPEERTSIINKLMGQIVQMSQQKFASNVVEKCLTFGTREERQTLVDEMLGSDDENGPLQVMMKDQFANYVVQKVLEICDDQQLELILNRIKVHLNALKKYTYGKHIVARVEKLVAAGERRISFLASYST